MKRNLYLTAGILFLFPTFVLAVPPSTIEADYVKEDGKLYVIMGHVSRDHTHHYIRKTEIFINGKEAAVEFNRQQIDPNSYGFAISLSPKENDEVTIKAFCSEGGSKEVSLVIPEEKSDQDANKPSKPESEVKAKVLAYESFRADVGIYDSKADVYGNKSEIFDSKVDPMKSKAGVYGSKKETMSDQTDVYGSKSSAVEEKGGGY
jgi:hypothetical protein